MKTTNVLPSLEYPFPNGGLNPYVQQAERKCEEWIQTIYHPKMSSVLEKSNASGTLFGHFAARMYPNANQERIFFITKFLLWGLMSDDYFEQLDVDAQRNAQRLYDHILIDGYNPKPDDLPIFHEFMALKEMALKLMPSKWIYRFADAVNMYLEGVIEEAYYKKSMIWPTVGEYTRVRQKSACVYPLFAIFELSSGMMLPDSIYYSPPFKRLVELTCNILAWTNDYYSINKEKGTNVMNLILICQHWEKVELHEAYEIAVKLHDQDVAEIVTICNSLPDFGEHQEAVNRFLENMQLCIHGQRDWYTLDTHRYPLVIERN